MFASTASIVKLVSRMPGSSFPKRQTATPLSSEAISATMLSISAITPVG